MADQIKLASVEHEYKRWEVRLQWPTEVVGLSAGTWASTGPNREHSFGMTVMAPAPEHFRQMAAALVEAAEVIETDIANPSEPVEDLYRESFAAASRELDRTEGDPS